ncbi:HD domain-containing protein [Microbacterium laevaniformans]|uniref:HD domain-containing protein n=2 Tax=Microbacterium laevaniformans TaxID=36807 RepID=UPI00195CA18A|nr:HD domain-containing protein [Microbacterium laevaniformans]
MANIRGADGGSSRLIRSSALVLTRVGFAWCVLRRIRSLGVMGSDLVVRARAVAEDRLVSLPRRWAHVQGVAARATGVTLSLGCRSAEEIVAAAWLHDVGYADSVAVSGFHPVDGALFARGERFPELVVSLIAFHTGAEEEATQRGLSTALGEFAAPAAEALDVVTFCDLTTSVDGVLTDAHARIAEILDRYEPGDPVHLAVSASAPRLLASVSRVESRLAAAR